MASVRGGFVRIPTSWFDHLLTIHLSGSELRIVLWVVRRTLGWNRHTTLFTWYQIAKDLGLDRAGVLRAGKGLLAGGMLQVAEGRIGLQNSESYLPAEGHVSGDASHPVTTNGGEICHRNRGLASPVYRRAIESSKDKTAYIARTSPQHPAGAAQPIAGKYDDISAI